MDPVHVLASGRDIWLVLLLGAIYMLWRWHDRALRDLEDWLKEHPAHKRDFTTWLAIRKRQDAEAAKRREQDYQDRIWGPCFCIGDPPLGPDGRCKSCHRTRRS